MLYLYWVYFICLLDESIEKISLPGQQSMMMREVVGARLDNHLISNLTTPTFKKCALRCLEVTACVSLNYIISTGVCELNDVIYTQYKARKSAIDYHQDIGRDYIHYTL